MKVVVKDFINEFETKKIMNSKVKPNAVEEFIRSKLEIVEYIPFNTKREIVDIIVSNSIKEEDGIKKVDSISQYLSFIVSMLCAHTNLQMSDNPADDYDALSKSGLLEQIITTFQKSYSECEALLKLAIADELVDNNLSVVVSKFLNGVLGKLDDFGDTFKGLTENLDTSKLLGTNMKEEEIAKVLGFVNKLNK